METWDAITSRRNVRSFTDQPIPAGVQDVDRARELLGFPADRNWAFLISLGYPADRPLRPVRKPDRRPFDDVVHRGHW
jgi:nitroreductase